jgi:hypothetical protein
MPSALNPRAFQLAALTTLLWATAIPAVAQTPSVATAAPSIDQAVPAAPVADVTAVPTSHRSSPGRLWLPLTIGYVAVQAADVHSTFRVIDAGGAEGNPILGVFGGGRVGMVAVKAGMTALAVLGTRRLAKRHPVAATVFLVAANCGYAYVAYRNYGLARSIAPR